jgi:hypothetical protein
MRKRKPSPGIQRWGLFLVFGVLALLIITVYGTWLLVSNTAQPTLAPYPTEVALILPTMPPLPTAIPAPEMQPAWALPTGGHLVYGTIAAEISSFDGDGIHSIGVRGADVTVAPDGQTLAYTREGRLYIYRDGTETRINAPDSVTMPAWNADGTALVFVVDSGQADRIYRLRQDRNEALPLLTVRELGAPPISSPTSNRILIAEIIAPQQTAFYTIDPLCFSEAACKESRIDIATVPYPVAWAAYHPSGTFIAFTDRMYGKLFALQTGSKEVKLLIEDYVYKRRVAFGADPTKLVYTDSTDDLYLLDLNSKAAQWLIPTSVASVSWAGGS